MTEPNDSSGPPGPPGPPALTVPADPKSPAEGVLAALRKLVRPSSPEEIAAATGLTEPTVRRTLGRLVAAKDARRAGGGRFTASKHRV